ncbi:DUF58 domain-containing protein [Glaciimonas soli]|uniref:DUF58 domain-containing protein n=1 Tax=Glaciimonas soli TaxID=2590999 RepID=A0A843YTI6_9BURK|nr:DUF58 domain-containing protein [Glaciimonas soli]MQR02530.1 DUF58 domain-containing protein [Glaciimonas soli]
MLNRLQKILPFKLPSRSHAAETGEVFLSQRRVYIVPSGAGFAFAGVLILLFVAAINYNLSLGFALTFLLASCAIITMHLTFRNLAYLYLSTGKKSPVFAGQTALFELHLINRRTHPRYAIWLKFITADLPHIEQAIDIAASTSANVVLGSNTYVRGWLAAPKIRLQTRFPLGLLRAWSYWQPDAQVLVYPQPEALDTAPALPVSAQQNGEGDMQSGHDDFAGVRAYQAGDSLKHLAWRQMAKLNTDENSTSFSTLLSKQFDGGGASTLLIDYSTLPYAMDVESKLSRMTRWVLEAEMRGLPYAFKLGDIFYAPAVGAPHQRACLQALALFDEA